MKRKLNSNPPQLQIIKASQMVQWVWYLLQKHADLSPDPGFNERPCPKQNQNQNTKQDSGE